MKNENIRDERKNLLGSFENLKNSISVGILRKGASSPSLSMKLKGEKSKQSNDNLLDDASSAISNKKRKLETRFGFLKVK